MDDLPAVQIKVLFDSPRASHSEDWIHPNSDIGKLLYDRVERGRSRIVEMILIDEEGTELHQRYEYFGPSST